jgi:FlaA1/EpsC-like NDP-sugar epimerase
VTRPESRFQLGSTSILPTSAIELILDLPRSVKRIVALLTDAMICVLSVWLSFYLRLGYFPDLFSYPLHPAITSMVLAVPIFISFGLYRAIFRYNGWEAITAVIRAVALYALPFAVIYTIIGVTSVPRTIGLIQPILLLLLVSSIRLVARIIFEKSYTSLWRSNALPRVLIYGAGKAGRELAGAIASSREMHLAGFVDDDAALWGSTLRGVPILSPDSLKREVVKRKITDILLAIPSSTRNRRGEILHDLRELNLHVRTLPSMIDIARGNISVNDLREPEIEDLLGRTPVPPDDALLRRNIEGRTVMITGAGGSIGSELCRQILTSDPAVVLLVDHSEYNLYAIHLELSRLAKSDANRTPVLIPLLASVCDSRRIEEIMVAWQPATIIHAAAYKHVPLVEHNVVEGVRNNVLGTLTLARHALRHGVKNFILISTDKAVRPTNIMGATKRLSEMVLQALQQESAATIFAMVRFGNVLGSSGSVIPLFKDQIAAGGPVTITHLEITRYFMTMPEAAQLVLQAGTMARGGEVFVLDMGEPVRIIDLARNMIELSGLKVRDETAPDGDIEIKITGLRPGEKLYEELLIGEQPIPSQHPRIFQAQEAFLALSELEALLEELTHILDAGNASAARDLLRRIVTEFQPNSDLVDWIHKPDVSGVRS